MAESNILDLFFDNMRRLLFPEEWIALDFSVSKIELITLLIVDRRGKIIMSEIADFIRVPLSTATGVINRLVHNELLQRERSESDRRIVTVYLSEKGQQMADAFKNTLSTYTSLLEQNLTDDEKQLLYKVASKIFDILETATVEENDIRTAKIKPIPID